MKIKKILFTALLLLPTLSFSVTNIDPKELDELSKGAMIKKVDWKEGYVWPEVTIYVLLNHAPLDNINVFLDFEAHKKYIPDMIESKILKKVSENQTHVYFEMEMPWPVKKTSHVTNNVVTNNTDGSYTLKWNLVKAEMLKATDGYMTFSPYEGKTLLKYVSFIVPNSSFAGMFKDRVAKDVEKSVTKITKHLTATLNKKDHLFSTSKKESTQNNL
jgi:hypothetical protein